MTSIQLWEPNDNKYIFRRLCSTLSIQSSGFQQSEVNVYNIGIKSNSESGVLNVIRVYKFLNIFLRNQSTKPNVVVIGFVVVTLS